LATSRLSLALGEHNFLVMISPLENKTRLGLALSGGGYRAAAFHLGTLNKLHELGILKEVDVLSTISGGSITGTSFCLEGQFDYFPFQERMKRVLTTNSIIGYVLRSREFLLPALLILAIILLIIGLQFTEFPFLSLVLFSALVWVLLKYQFNILPISRVIERAYDTYFYSGRTLPDLPPRPLMAVGSSNLQTGRPFTFSQNHMGDSGYEALPDPILFHTNGFPISRAVAASSCVPFAFTPVVIAKQFFVDASNYTLISPKLIDGGVYDNQGIQKLTQLKSRYACNTIIISDAGSKMVFDKSYYNTVSLLLRTVDLFMNRIKNVQMAANLFQNVQVRSVPIAYISLGWRLENCIPGFVNNMISGNVLSSVLAARVLPQKWIEAPEVHRKEIEQHLTQQVGFDSILARNPTEAELEMASQVGTNLTPLLPAQLDALMRHAENLTELQVKLYLP
jgi:NTE family protein